MSSAASSASGSVVAVDIGASSGRVIVGRVGPRELRLDEVHRFPNEPVGLPDGLHWDVLRLYREILDGLRAAARRESEPPSSIGVDSWGVDFGLLDGDGVLVANPWHYRDARHAPGADLVHERARRRASTSGPASSSCRSTRSTSWPRAPARRRSAAAGRCSSSRTCSATG